MHAIITYSPAVSSIDVKFDEVTPEAQAWVTGAKEKHKLNLMLNFTPTEYVFFFLASVQALPELVLRRMFSELELLGYEVERKTVLPRVSTGQAVPQYDVHLYRDSDGNIWEWLRN